MQFGKAVALEPHFAVALAKLGRQDAALVELRKALELDAAYAPCAGGRSKNGGGRWS